MAETLVQTEMLECTGSSTNRDGSTTKHNKFYEIKVMKYRSQFAGEGDIWKVITRHGVRGEAGRTLIDSDKWQTEHLATHAALLLKESKLKKGYVSKGVTKGDPNPKNGAVKKQPEAPPVGSGRFSRLLE